MHLTNYKTQNGTANCHQHGAMHRMQLAFLPVDATLFLGASTHHPCLKAITPVSLRSAPSRPRKRPKESIISMLYPCRNPLRGFHCIAPADLPRTNIRTPSTFTFCPLQPCYLLKTLPHPTCLIDKSTYNCLEHIPQISWLLPPTSRR